MKSILGSLILACLTFLLVCCAGGLKTASRTESGAVLNSYKTYAWIDPNNPDENSQQDDGPFIPLILQEADAALQKKGMKIDTKEPDCVFVFDARVEEQVKYSKAPAYMYSYYYGGPGYFPAYGQVIPGAEVLPRSYAEGLLAFNMFDTKTKKVIWTGWTAKEITGKSDIEAIIKRAVKDIFSRLPIKHKE